MPSHHGDAAIRSFFSPLNRPAMGKTKPFLSNETREGVRCCRAAPSSSPSSPCGCSRVTDTGKPRNIKSPVITDSRAPAVVSLSPARFKMADRFTIYGVPQFEHALRTSMAKSRRLAIGHVLQYLLTQPYEPLCFCHCDADIPREWSA